ncbi:MAG: PQQ-dependent sugar dehydrogenase [Planctomycetes bacterium]|nr:PQQ-dependent sugar dehydrogenase [Planctomycetota bacterium]
MDQRRFGENACGSDRSRVRRSARRAAACALVAAFALGGSLQRLDALPPDFRVEEVVAGLENPVTFDFAPDGRVFIGERTTGRIRVFAEGALLLEPAATVAVSTAGERGLLGLALDPRFAENGYLFAFHTCAPHEQRITRLCIEGNRAAEATPIFDRIPAALVHNGGAIGFGPDGMLYFTVGDNGVAANARDIRLLAGKMHRIRSDGTIPPDNPWPATTAFCLGLRNSFGFTFRAATYPAVAFVTDNGTTEHDEINRVVAGGDYGWPLASGAAATPPLVDPIYSWSPTTAPAGIVYYDGANFPLDAQGDLFVAEYATGSILRVDLAKDGAQALRGRRFLDGEFGNLFALELAPDGTLWFSSASALYRIVNSNPPQRFVRGNVDGTNGIDGADSLRLLRYLIYGDVPECLAAADVDANQRVDFADVTMLLGFLHGTVPGIPAPFPACGLDPESQLSCVDQPSCP